MAGVFKEHLNKECDKWMAEIEKKGETRMDMASAFERIFAHTINHICFGEDLNDDEFMFFYYDPEKNSFTERMVSMREAMHSMTKQLIVMLTNKMTHPITGPINLLFGT